MWPDYYRFHTERDQDDIVITEFLTSETRPGLFMAQRTKFTYDRCGFSVDYWDDGNRYLEWPAGTRNYLYHPGDAFERERIMNLIHGRSPTGDEYKRAFELYGGNESEFLCLSCAEVNRIDPKRDLMKCKKCGTSSLRAVSGLAKTECPKMPARAFRRGFASWDLMNSRNRRRPADAGLCRSRKIKKNAKKRRRKSHAKSPSRKVRQNNRR